VIDLDRPLASSPVRPRAALDARLIAWAFGQSGVWRAAEAGDALRVSTVQVFDAVDRLIDRGLVKRVRAGYLTTTP
jgi:Mn-dependent DtxR family transcriptional regulator